MSTVHKVWTRILFGFVLAAFAFCPRASAQQLTSCDAASPSTPCIQKFVDALPYPPFMFSTSQLSGQVAAYDIAARQFPQPMLSCSNPNNLPSNCTTLLPMTTVWGYGQTGFPYDYNAPTTVCSLDGLDAAPCFSSPAPTLFTLNKPNSTLTGVFGTRNHVRWINDLACHQYDTNWNGTSCTTGTAFTYTPGVKPSFTNHWANPGLTCNNTRTAQTDCQGVGNYTGPVPLVAHAHGAISASESDGIPEAWNLPTSSSYNAALYRGFGSDWCQANPATYNTQPIPDRDFNCDTASNRHYSNDGAARFLYNNRQFPTTLFFHDHALGTTTEDVYMGLAGFYLINASSVSPATWCNGNATNCGSASNPFNWLDDMPHDCTISYDGKCHIGSQVTFDSVPGGLPLGDCSTPGPGSPAGPNNTGINQFNCLLLPLAITDKAFNLDGSLKFSEHGNVIVVNGKTWPVWHVQPRKYRVKIVIAAPTSRFDLTFPSASNDAPGTPTVTMTQIGADGGFLPNPVKLTKPLSLMPGERADLIVDFSNFFSCAPPFGPGCSVNLLNANGTGDTGVVMQFSVDTLLPGCDVNSNIAACFPPTADTSCNLPYLSCTANDTLPHRVPVPSQSVRQVSLFDDHLGNCPNAGCVNSMPLPWDGTVTETPSLYPVQTNLQPTETWEMYDFMDSHPMHLHEAQFQVVNRENMSTHVVYNCKGTAINALGQTVNCASPPVPGETGFKDTVQANGGQITRVRVTFRGPAGPGGPTSGDSVPEFHAGLFAWHCHINPHEDNEMMRPMCVLYGDGRAADQQCLAKP